MSLCRINLFVVFILFFLSQKNQQTTKKRGQIKCGGNVPKPSWNEVLEYFNLFCQVC